MSRIAVRFAALKAARKKAFIPFITAGDPGLDISAELLSGLPGAGCDLVEIGMPFSDPMADGAAIEQANLRAFAQGIKLSKVLKLVSGFRARDKETPIILMGYANPIFTYGVDAFLADAKSAGVDGLLLVDLPPEEDTEIRLPARSQGIDIIRLVTPTTDAKRRPVVLHEAAGFLYYVSVTGLTGSKKASAESVRTAIEAIRPHSILPVVVGFGISTPEQAKEMAVCADGVVVGSAIVNRIASHLDDSGNPKAGLVKDVLAFVETLAQATHNS